MRRMYTEVCSPKKNLSVLGIWWAVERWMKPEDWSRGLMGRAVGRGSGGADVAGMSL